MEQFFITEQIIQNFQHHLRLEEKNLNMILQTICGTGIRVSELQFITVEAVRKGEAVVFCKDKRRSAFIVKALQRKLLKYAAEKNIKLGCIFITEQASHLTVQTFGEI